MKTFDFKGVLKAFYILMNADGDISKVELEKFDEICKSIEFDMGFELFEDYKQDIISEFEEKVLNADNLQELLINEIDSALCFADSAVRVDDPNEDLLVLDRFITPRWLIWNMLAIAYSNGEYHDNEKAIIAHVAEKTEQQDSILLEMEQCIKAVYSIETELEFVINKDGLYSVVRPIVVELENRRDNIIQNAMQLIADENDDSIEKINVQKNAYARAKDALKEKTAPVTDVIKEKAAPVTDVIKEKAAPVTDVVAEKANNVYSQTKDKIKESGIVEDVQEKANKVYSQTRDKIKDSGIVEDAQEKAGKLVEDIKAKAKEIDVEDKVIHLINRFRKG